jgi:hypothetical protein
MSELERIRTAYHEAGHAVVADALGIEVEHVSIMPDGASAGRCQFGQGGDLGDFICFLIAGGVAEACSPAEAQPGLDGCDWLRIDRLLDSHLPDPIRQYRLWQRLDRRTRELVAQQWRAIERVASLLLIHEEIPGDLVRRERLALPPIQGGTIGGDGEGRPKTPNPSASVPGAATDEEVSPFA